MKQIAPDVTIEQNSLGLYAGIVQTETSMVLIDSPLKPVDGGFWKTTVEQNECSEHCYMIVLDTNYDRLLSIKGCDCVLVSHADAISPIRLRTPKVSEDSQQPSENSESVVSGNRMLPPEIIFDTELSLHLDSLQVNLEHHPGSNHAGIWVIIPEREIVFVGDTVVVDQPPFLAYANLKAWEKDLNLLLSDQFSDYQIASSRSGVVDRDQIKTMSKHIAMIRNIFETLMESKVPIEQWYDRIPQIISKFNHVDLFNSELFYNRLRWGITMYYDANCREKG